MLLMGKFHQIVDDGTALASSAEDTFPNIEKALLETIRSAAMIAIEELHRTRSQAFSCEVQDVVTSEQRAATVRVSVDFH
jgi:hypothetical protein